MKIEKLKGNYLVREVLNACGAYRVDALQEATLEKVPKYAGFAYKIVHPEKQEQIDELFEKAKPFFENQVEENVVLGLMDLATLCLLGRDCYLDSDAHKAVRNAYLSIMKEKIFRGRFSNYQKMREDAKWMGKIADQLEVLDAFINPLKDGFKELSINQINENFAVLMQDRYASITMEKKFGFFQYSGTENTHIHMFVYAKGKVNQAINLQHCSGIIEGIHGEELIVGYITEQGEEEAVRVDLYTGNNVDTGELLSEEHRILIEKYLDSAIEMSKEIMEEMKK